MYRLYHFPLSPFSRKVRLVFGEKRIEIELIEEDYWKKRSKFMRLNPAGKIPVLRSDNFILAESNAICEYLEEKYPNPALLSKSLEKRGEIRRLVGWFDDKFYHEVTLNFLHERMMKRIMDGAYPDSRKIQQGMRNIKFHLNYIDWLLDRRHWLAGSKMSLADFSAAAQLSCLDYLSDVDWNYSTQVKNWYATLKSRPSFRSLLTDQVYGFIQPSHYADLDF